MVSRSLVETLLPRRPELDRAARARVLSDVTDFVQQALAMAPWHLRIGVNVLTLCLTAWLSIYLGLTRLRAITHDMGERAIELFERMPNPAPGLVRLYRSLAMLAFYDHPIVMALMGIESSEERQTRFRELRRGLDAGIR
ncbi:MAG TPA: hypothetical protein VN461_04840 [Vicinamibacteria bacterium]|jgi:hypothetical protein|nr:hypothetical protein [Vicinamibacteria bacterium]